MIPSEGSLRNTNTNIEEAGLANHTDESMYHEEGWRFMNLGIFIMLCLINSLPTHTFTTINSIISDIYGIDKVVVAINTLLFPISHPIMAFLANWILDKYGLKLGCSMGAVLLSLGVWMRILINESFAPVLIGSLLAAIGNIFIINSPSKMATLWFRPSVVARVTALGVMANLASNGLGVVLPSLFVEKSSTKSQIQRMLIIEAIIVTVPCVLTLILFRNKPSKPPSFAASIEKDSDYIKDLKKLFSNKNYLMLLLSISMSYGTLTAFTTCIEYVASPFGFEKPEDVSSLMLVCAMVAGFVGSVFFIILLKKSLAYKKILATAIAGAMIQLVMLNFALDTRKLWVILVTISLLGFFLIPQVPIFLELGCELAFPIGEASSSGFLLAGGQLTGFVAGLLGINLLGGEDKKWVFVVIGSLCGLMCIGVVGMLFVKEDLKRNNYEKSASQLSNRTQ